MAKPTTHISAAASSMRRERLSPSPGGDRLLLAGWPGSPNTGVAACQALTRTASARTASQEGRERQRPDRTFSAPDADARRVPLVLLCHEF